MTAFQDYWVTLTAHSLRLIGLFKNQVRARFQPES